MTGGSGVVEVPVERHDEWLRRFLGTHGHWPDEEALAFFRAIYPCERAIAISTEAGYVATSAAIDLDLVLPGGATVAMAGVTAVTVDPTMTRRGILRAMLDRLHRRAMDEGRPVAGLGASEWPIYGRFGYGPATWHDSATVTVRDAGWRADAPGGELEPYVVDGAQARRLAHLLHQRQASATPGEALRPEVYWSRLAMPEPTARHIDSVLVGSGVADTGHARSVAVAHRGLVTYRVRTGWTASRTPDDALQVTNLLAADAEAAAALWRHILSVDLVTEVRVPRVPVDDPVRWWVSDARRIVGHRHDGLWLRVLDVATVLQARRWSGSGGLTLRVHDKDGYACGTYRLDVDDGVCSCQPTTRTADLEADVATLGTMLLGGTPATCLLRGGRLAASDPRRAQLWDMLATPERSPFFGYPC